MKKLLYTILIFALLSCKPEKINKEDYMPGIDIPISKMNAKATISQSLGMEDVFKSMGLLSLELKNISEVPIEFPPDFGTSMFVLNKGEWIAIENSFGYPDGNIVLPAHNDYPMEISVDLLPILPAAEKPYVIRVIAIGTVKGQQEKVGAYIDITIQ